MLLGWEFFFAMLYYVRVCGGCTIGVNFEWNDAEKSNVSLQIHVKLKMPSNTPRDSEKRDGKALGFTRYLGDWGGMGESSIFFSFDGDWRYPFYPTYGEGFFYIDTYGVCGGCRCASVLLSHIYGRGSRSGGRSYRRRGRVGVGNPSYKSLQNNIVIGVPIATTIAAILSIIEFFSVCVSSSPMTASLM